jgi:hypothetical protein
MRRVTALIGTIALVAAACGGSASPTATTVPVPPTLSAAGAPATPAPTSSSMALSAAVTWDGQTCAYAGPSTVPPGGAVTFTMTNTAGALKGGLKGAGLLVMPVRDGTTWETIVAYLKDHHVADVPDWARIPGVREDGTGEVQILYAPVAAGGTMTVVMARSLYYVMCGTPENDRGYPSTLVKVGLTSASVTAAPATPPLTASPMVLSASVTFDGQACTYVGPSVIPRGAAVTFTLTNAPAALAGSLPGAGLLVMPVRDGTTWETIVAYLKDHHVADVPDWARIPGVPDDGTGEVQILSAPVLPGDSMRVLMTRNLYYVMCGTHADDRGYPAVLLKVLDA